MNLEEELNCVAKITNGFKPMKHLADILEESYSSLKLTTLAYELYDSDIYQIRMVGVFLFGKLSSSDKKLFQFMRDEVAQDESWRVQEILAMAFDTYCNAIGYELALKDIEEWLSSSCANNRRAVSEGLRIWTSRPYFKDYPEVAISLLTQLRNDESEYVRKSCGNALRDISKKYSEMIVCEVSKWGNSPYENQVRKLILKNKKLEELIKV